MSLYHFHDCRGAEVESQDHEGTDLPDIQTAQHEAARTLGYILAHQPHLLWQHGERIIRCTDHAGLILFEVRAITTLAPALSSQKKS